MRLGLCAGCSHRREIRNRRGSTFHLCNRSRTDPRYPRYPPLPVLTCEGFAPEAGSADPTERRAASSPGESPPPPGDEGA